jgi:hypothetical protein
MTKPATMAYYIVFLVGGYSWIPKCVERGEHQKKNGSFLLSIVESEIEKRQAKVIYLHISLDRKNLYIPSLPPIPHIPCVMNSRLIWPGSCFLILSHTASMPLSSEMSPWRKIVLAPGCKASKSMMIYDALDSLRPIRQTRG